MGKVDCVVLVLEFNLESECVGSDVGIFVFKIVDQHLMVVSGIVDVSLIVAEVGYVVTASLPADVVGGCVCVRVHQRSHAFLVKTVRLR